MTSVFRRTDYAGLVKAKPGRLKVPANLQGHTTHFNVYVDASLGATGSQAAATVLAKCESDYATVAGYFGGISAGPFNVILFSYPPGAYHATCRATDLYCDVAAGPPDGAYSEFLNVAEFVEVFEAIQAKGWACGRSNGEALSRVLSADAYPAELDGFATAHRWIDSRRPNYVDLTYSTDTSSVANGCAVLFINWLRFQLGYSLAQIVAAAAPTLGRSYAKLSGRTDGFKQFKALINAHFPAGTASGLTTDNPFPL